MAIFGLQSFVLPVAGLAWCQVMAGCGSREQDVTSDPAFGNFKIIVRTWRATVPLKLVERDATLFLISADTPMEGSREIAEEPPGTKLKIERLMFNKGVDADLLWITGSLIDGPNKGKSLRLDSNFFPHDVLLYYQLHNAAIAATTRPTWAVSTKKLVECDP